MPELIGPPHKENINAIQEYPHFTRKSLNRQPAADPNVTAAGRQTYSAPM